MTASPVIVQIDNRIRLLSSLLALTTWPDQEQAYYPHGVHAHARNLRQALAEAENHPAVLIMQEALESALTLGEIFSYARCLSWPGLRLRSHDAPAWAPANWPAHIRDFAHAHRLTEVWDRDKAAWQSAETAARAAMARAGDLAALLARFFGPPGSPILFVPNLGYPSTQTLAFRDGGTVVCVCPPPVAWGTNPPWPYDDNPADPAREMAAACARLLLIELLDAAPEESDALRRAGLPVPNTFRARHPGWQDQLAVLLVGAITTLYLRETFGQAEADAYILMTHRAHGFEVLPGAVEALEKYLAAQAQGQFETVLPYLSTFIRSLRITDKQKKS